MQKVLLLYIVKVRNWKKGGMEGIFVYVFVQIF